MLLIDHYVAQSPIHGLGVFSAESVPKGTLVWEFNDLIDHEIPESKLRDLRPHIVGKIHKHAWYHPESQCFWLGADGDYFMNHAETPTLELIQKTLFASKNIFIGDELTCDYRVVNVLDFSVAIAQNLSASVAV